MSTVIDTAGPLRAARTLSKLSPASPLSSPGNSVPGLPRAAPSAPDSMSDSRDLSDSGESTSSAAHGPAETRAVTPPVAPATAAPPPAAPRTLSGLAAAPRDDAQPQLTQPPTHGRAPSVTRRPSFGLSFLLSLSNSIRGGSGLAPVAPPAALHHFMSNSPTIANLSHFTSGDSGAEALSSGQFSAPPDAILTEQAAAQAPPITRENTSVEVSDVTRVEPETATEADSATELKPDESGCDKDGFFSVRLTPIIDHSSSNTGLYFVPVIRRVKPNELLSIGRYTEKNKSAAHAPQGSSAPIVFKSKVVLRTHAMFQCNDDGLWFLKDCKSSSGTFLNNIRLSQASQELTLWPLIDGDTIQLGLDYRGGTEEIYRSVKMRCEFNRSWQRKVNQFNLDIHKKMKNLGIEDKAARGTDEFSECAICLLKLEPCQALFISPCSHSWHYKCIRPIIIKSYPQFYCPNCRSMCDLETDIEDDD